MEKNQDQAYKLFTIPNNQIREEVLHIRENVSHHVSEGEWKEEVLTKLEALDAKVSRLLQLLEKE